MNWKKKLLALGLSLALTLSLAACGQKAAETGANRGARTDAKNLRKSRRRRTSLPRIQNCSAERPHRHGTGGADESERHGQ